MTLQRAARALAALGTVWAAIVLCAAMPAASQSASAPSPSFDDLYDRGQRLNASIKTLTAHFVETTTSSLLTRPLVASGTLAVVRPFQVVLRYTDPDSRTLLIEKNRMTLSWPSRSVRQTTDIGATQGRIQKYFVNGSVADLRHEFEVGDFGTDEKRGTYHVGLTPKRKQIRETLSRIDLWVNQSSLLLMELRMTFANGDSKGMTFDDVVPNAAVDPAAFAIDR